MSTPARRRWTAVVWRIVCGLTRLPIIDGTDLAANFAWWVTRRCIPNRVNGWFVRPRKTASFAARPITKRDSETVVAGHRGHIRILFPLPRMRADGEDLPSCR